MSPSSSAEDRFTRPVTRDFVREINLAECKKKFMEAAQYKANLFQVMLVNSVCSEESLIHQTNHYKGHSHWWGT